MLVVVPVVPLDVVAPHEILKTFCFSPPGVPGLSCFALALYMPDASVMFADIQCPLESAGPHVPLMVELPATLAPPCGAIDHVPVELASKWKPDMWKTHPGFGSLSMSSSGSDALMILMVPLFPGESA